MKIAICISGLARGNIKRNIGYLKKAFPDVPMFFSSWEEHKNDESERYNSTYYPEPTMHYNPWCECVKDNPHPKYHVYKKQFLEKTGESHKKKLLNATKQLIAHAYQVADLPQEYDMIIRARWDTVVSEKVNFSKYLEQSYNENMAIGFAIRGGRWTDLNRFKDIDHVFINEDTDIMWSRDWSYWLNDFLIFHPRNLYDTELVHKLHKEKKLWPAEYGWYQMLSTLDNHHCVYGGVVIEKFWRNRR
jgi:hypothetical protein